MKCVLGLRPQTPGIYRIVAKGKWHLIRQWNANLFPLASRLLRIRSRRCWLGRSEKDRFDMAYPTGFRKTRAGTVSAHPGYGCRWGENERGDSNGKTTHLSEKPACRGGVRRVPRNRRAYPIS